MLLAALAGLAACGEPELVEDAAGLIAADERARLAEHHAYLLADHDIDYRVVTAADVGDINVYAARRFAALDVGARSETGRGLLLVIDAAADVVRLEVGHALEGVFPDAFVAYVEHRQMVPFFRSERVADGILATTELIVTRAQRAQANAGFEGETWIAGSGGAGATAQARIGEGPETSFRGPSDGIRPGATPERTLEVYFGAMRQRNANPSLAIYTAETQAMLADWTVTPAQMDGVLKAYRGCRGEVRYGPRGERAVIRYRVDDRRCAPWFFRKAGTGWQLDLATMQRAIRFGRDNSWRLVREGEHGYGFAFADWRFDRHGFPRKAR